MQIIVCHPQDGPLEGCNAETSICLEGPGALGMGGWPSQKKSEEQNPNGSMHGEVKNDFFHNFFGLIFGGLILCFRKKNVVKIFRGRFKV
jgi:hypothetical protein